MVLFSFLSFGSLFSNAKADLRRSFRRKRSSERRREQESKTPMSGNNDQQSNATEGTLTRHDCPRAAGCKQEISRCSVRNEREARPRTLKSYCYEGDACCVANVSTSTFVPCSLLPRVSRNDTQPPTKTIGTCRARFV